MDSTEIDQNHLSGNATYQAGEIQPVNTTAFIGTDLNAPSDLFIASPELLGRERSNRFLDVRKCAMCRTVQESKHNDNPPGPRRVFHKLVGPSDICERDSFANLEPPPPRL
jgi:hypothetical protein